ncbi:MAG: DctP family TRAP transporter solute-binding subunit [Pseudomonadota bacterium]|nr:DctP family TRAP transporter solute-binding subunit [Pseudomonadota bacterium]
MALLAGAALIALGAAGYAPQARADTYRLTAETSEATSRTKAGVRFGELFEQETNGEHKVRVFPNAQLTGGDQIKQAEFVGRGDLDFVVTSAITVSPLVPEMSVFSLPYLYANYDEVDATLNGKPAERMAEIMAEHGIVILGWGESGFREVTNNVKPITGPDDLKGLKMRVAGPMFIDIMTALGANPQQMQWSETFGALQQGVVDGQENPIGAVIIPQRVYEVQKYLTAWHYSYDPAFLAVSKKLWDSWDEDTRQKARKAAEQAMNEQKEATREQTADGIAFLKDQGMVIHEPGAEEIDAYRKATQSAFDKWADRVGDDLVGLFKSTIKESGGTSDGQVSAN